LTAEWALAYCTEHNSDLLAGFSDDCSGALASAACACPVGEGTLSKLKKLLPLTSAYFVPLIETVKLRTSGLIPLTTIVKELAFFK
jgi:hypothetical protein